MNDMPELLAPAGTLEAGIAAFTYGADAVYLGMKSFSARADAGNFTLEELEILLGIARRDPQHPRRVYVAVNTLIKEEELPQLIDTLARLEDVGVDALIVQDLAVVELVRRYFPKLTLHASTQMVIHNAEGVRQAQKLGFTRVVAAREVSVNELSAMAQVPGIEIEAFLHGALCYSYSGICLLSRHLHETSGNRGECSYVCRNKFTFSGMENPPEPCCPMSMKDLALGSMIPAMKKAGVASLKIEGRKKTPLYVAAVTNYYRKLLDHSFDVGEEKQCENDVRTIFSRPWTKLYAQTPYNKDTTDPHTTGPRGVDIGAVSRVVQNREGDFLRFTIQNHPIEKHDGLQVELPTMEKPYGFGVDEIRQFPQGGGDRWERVFSAIPGKIVEIPLPPGHPEIPAGARIAHSSSQDVKRRYEWPSPRPNLDRLRTPLKITLELQGKSISLTAESPCLPSPIAFQREYPTPFAKANQPEKTQTSLEKAFQRLGNSRYALESLQISNPGGLFVPASVTNDLRRDFLQEIENRRSTLLEAKIAYVQQETKSTILSSPGTATDSTPAPAFPGTAVNSTPAPAVPETATNSTPASAFPEAGSTERTSKPLAKLPPITQIRLDSPEQVSLLPEGTISAETEIVLLLRQDLNLADVPTSFRLSLPVIQRPAAKRDILPLLKQALLLGFTKWELTNLGSLELLLEAGADLSQCNLTAHWTLYASNHLAAEVLFSLGVSHVTASPEDSLENQLQLAARLGNRYIVPLWERPVLGHSATCLMASAKGACPGPRFCTFTETTITNRKGEQLYVVNDHCNSLLLAATPTDHRPDRPALTQAGTSSFRLDFAYQRLSEEKIQDMLS